MGSSSGVHPELAGRLLAPDSGIVFIRLSVNAVTEKAIQKHWGVKDAGEVLHQFAGLEGLLAVRERLRPRFEALGRAIPSIQISTIIDHKNVDDLLPICRTIAGIFGRYPHPRGDEDVMILRPLTDHRKAVYGCDDHSESEIRQILGVVGRGGAGRRIVEEAGLSLVLGFGLDLVDAGVFPSYADVIRGGIPTAGSLLGPRPVPDRRPGRRRLSLHGDELRPGLRARESHDAERRGYLSQRATDGLPPDRGGVAMGTSLVPTLLPNDSARPDCQGGPVRRTR